MKIIKVQSKSQTEFINITKKLEVFIKEEGLSQGLLHLFVLHTTAALTINEGADPSVLRDIERVLAKLVPWNDHYTHLEGNTAAHVKSSLLGSSLQVFLEDGRLVLGTWQKVFFCEFDGPRNREILVKVT